MFKEFGISLLVNDVMCLQIDITDLSKLEIGQNVLNLHYQLQSVNITKFFHLYMFSKYQKSFIANEL